MGSTVPAEIAFPLLKRRDIFYQPAGLKLATNEHYDDMLKRSKGHICLFFLINENISSILLSLGHYFH